MLHRWARFECKYLISDGLAERIRQWIQPYVKPDPYAARSQDHSYRISSLYLDTHDLRLYHETVDGIEMRNKLRIRSYSREPGSPIFLEIKRRHDRVVEKVRSKVSLETVSKILAGHAPTADQLGLEGEARESYEEFVRVFSEIGALPVLHVGYRRQAYVGIFQEDVRVTFDREIIAAPAGERDALEDQGGADSIEPVKVVLELKFNERFPSWMQDLIRTFELDRTSYSKYGHSIERGGRPDMHRSSYLSRGADGAATGGGHQESA